jgi:hypothetical protein
MHRLLTAAAIVLGVSILLATLSTARDEPDWREVAGNGCNSSCTESARSESEARFCKPFCSCLVREIDDRKTNHSAERFLEELRAGEERAREENEKITGACLEELQGADPR